MKNKKHAEIVKRLGYSHGRLNSKKMSIIRYQDIYDRAYSAGNSEWIKHNSIDGSNGESLTLMAKQYGVSR